MAFLAALAVLVPLCCCRFSHAALSRSSMPASHACGGHHCPTDQAATDHNGPAPDDRSDHCRCPRIESSLTPESTASLPLAKPVDADPALPIIWNTAGPLAARLTPSNPAKPVFAPATSLLRLHCALVV